MNQNVNIDLSSVPLLKCSCESSDFMGRFQIKKVSALQSPNGVESAIGMLVGFICIKCQKKFDLKGNEIVEEAKTANQE